MELISVVIPVYNVEKYLRRCLDSVLAQTYQNVEVILVDDGSLDSSGHVCEEYAKKRANFNVIHKKNAGLGMARNTGLEYISGEYVTFLDSDDYIEPTFLESLYNTLKKRNVDVCKSGFRRITNTGEILYERRFEEQFFNKQSIISDFLPRLIGSAPEKKDSLEMCVCGALYNVEIIRKHNLSFFSERELISEDLVFNIDYMQHASSACTVSYIGYNYRVNVNSLTKKYQPNKFKSCMKFYTFVKEKLYDLNYDKETIYRLDRITFVKIRGCILQEKYSSNDPFRIMKGIKSICDDMQLREILEEYPIEKLAYRQKAFVYMLKYKQCFVLYLCMKLGLMD